MKDVPYGYCHCGCGQHTSIAKWTSPRDHMIKGEPRLFRAGHQKRNNLSYTIDPGTGCWLWDGHCNTSGYGQFRLGGPKMKLAHRYYWEQRFGSVPEGKELHHLCQIRRCVNPDHLELLSRKQHRPLANKPKPFLIWNTKLTSADVLEIRVLRGKETQSSLAKRFGVSQAHISRIQLGKAR